MLCQISSRKIWKPSLCLLNDFLLASQQRQPCLATYWSELTSQGLWVSRWDFLDSDTVPIAGFIRRPSAMLSHYLLLIVGSLSVSSAFISGGPSSLLSRSHHAAAIQVRNGGGLGLRMQEAAAPDPGPKTGEKAMAFSKAIAHPKPVAVDADIRKILPHRCALLMEEPFCDPLCVPGTWRRSIFISWHQLYCGTRLQWIVPSVCQLHACTFMKQSMAAS